MRGAQTLTFPAYHPDTLAYTVGRSRACMVRHGRRSAPGSGRVRGSPHICGFRTIPESRRHLFPRLMYTQLWVDLTPVTVTFPAGNQRISWPTTADDLRQNLTLWRLYALVELERCAVAASRTGAGETCSSGTRGILLNPRAWDAMDV